MVKVPNKKVQGWALAEMPGQDFLSYPVSFCASGCRAIFATTEQMIDSLQHFS